MCKEPGAHRNGGAASHVGKSYPRLGPNVVSNAGLSATGAQALTVVGVVGVVVAVVDVAVVVGVVQMQARPNMPAPRMLQPASVHASGCSHLPPYKVKPFLHIRQTPSPTNFLLSQLKSHAWQFAAHVHGAPVFVSRPVHSVLATDVVPVVVVVGVVVGVVSGGVQSHTLSFGPAPTILQFKPAHSSCEMHQPLSMPKKFLHP